MKTHSVVFFPKVNTIKDFDVSFGEGGDRLVEGITLCPWSCETSAKPMDAVIYFITHLIAGRKSCRVAFSVRCSMRRFQMNVRTKKAGSVEQR